MILYVLSVVVQQCSTALSPSSVEVLIQPNDRILFVGGTNTFLGSISDYGFITLLRHESEKVVRNVTFYNGASRTVKGLSRLARLRDDLIEHYRPTKVVLTLALTDSGEYSSPQDLLTGARFEVESILAMLVDRGIDTILCPLELTTDSVHQSVGVGSSSGGGETSHLLMEDFVWALSQVARDYGAMFVDLHLPLLKYLEGANMDDLPHSVLTFDGRTLNEAGHSLVAQVLVERLLGRGQQHAEFVENNAAALEKQRVDSLRSALHYHAQRELELAQMEQSDAHTEF